MKKYKIIVNGIIGTWVIGLDKEKPRQRKLKKGDIFIRVEGKEPLYYCKRNNIFIYDMREFVSKKWAKKL